MDGSVHSRRDGAVMTITIDRPERRNALNADVAAGIVAALDAAEAEAAARVVVLTGAGERAFCAGGDLRAGADGTPFAIDPADPRHYVAGLLRRMDACRLPLIARVNGHALAGGLGLVAACDLAVARQDAALGVTEVRVGLFPMMILPYLLRTLPYRVMMELCLTGEPLPAHDPRLSGLLNAVVPAGELDSRVAALAASVADKSPSGIRLGKQALTRIREMGTDHALEYAQFMLANMARTEDAREGFAAFAERRSPEWTGR